jgi:hypothetical protein
LFNLRLPDVNFIFDFASSSAVDAADSEQEAMDVEWMEGGSMMRESKTDVETSSDVSPASSLLLLLALS